ncbi:HAD family hydrolase [Tuwongella immobilis]|uniref:phosphoglycolate phosphatase n=1 Tax=Tuwongella immobilis TaxID=692036 RepID=A0A6C2YWA9_9BACT|nr:HAD-IIIA family hydrolase [Tuwongella immobilis]VIP05744.1 phosphoglycolate phosphatase : HAD-superfamily hydrolase OS=Thermoanaerobacter thermohydrosulfuricus WC1 GN=TthWC1_1184 PE=4 SV=1: HAD_2 [Tuwongella immobilis]VTS08844.1 phosphoglycolate phosphatase : HAD-superfamily hydrolase OS=Thermoanaerobacter thermohydrosulfuricus WC1 GN=TthWC1_1184 PE=4 SV=1: HAD_2 [Tuwongella immobilis]
MRDPIRAVLFDFDGTLADSFDAIIASVNHTRTAFGFEELSIDEIRAQVGWGLRQLMEVVVPSVNPEEAMAIYRDHHKTVMGTHTRLLPGVRTTVETLHKQGKKLAICSNKLVRFTQELIRVLEIAPFFDAVLGPDDVNNRAKPDPAMVLEAMKRLNVRPSETIYVGDMNVDIDTCRAAGIPVWVVPSGLQTAETLSKYRPDRILESMNELVPMLRLLAVAP